MTNNFDFNLRRGAQIERAIKDAIKRRYFVVMTSAIESGIPHQGPRIEHANGDVVVPDMHLLHGGARTGWIEVKWKAAPNEFRNRKRLEHGIDLSKLEQYEFVERHMGPVYLVIVEGCSGAILMQNLATLRSQGGPRYGTWPKDDKPSINWDRKCFVMVGNISASNGDTCAVIDWTAFETFATQFVLLEDIFP